MEARVKARDNGGKNVVVGTMRKDLTATTSILPDEYVEAISKVRKAEADLNAAIQALPDDIEVAIRTVDIQTIGQPAEREMVCVNIRKVL